MVLVDAEFKGAQSENVIEMVPKRPKMIHSSVDAVKAQKRVAGVNIYKIL